MFHSISWRLQISYGLLLLVVFAALLTTAFQLERDSQMSVVDAGLQARAVQLRGALSRLSRPRIAADGPGGLDLPRHDLRFGEDSESSHYYLIWRKGDPPELRFQSENAPADIAAPTSVGPIPESGLSRFRVGNRERILQTRDDRLILVGRNVSAELAMIRAQSTKLALAGGGLLLIGLIASHLVVRRALKPISEISDAATRIAGGALDERIETAGNLSELGRLGSVLNHTFDELENAYRRQARFTADASHELRTPVAVILSEIQSAPKLSRSVEEYEECLAVCEESAISMQKLLQQLMSLAQFDAGKGVAAKEPVELKQLIERCVGNIEALANENGVTVSQELGDTTCLGDPDRIAQVVNNLLGNAVAYNREGGHVVITLRSDREKVIVEVADTGTGIDSEDLPHVFQRFYRADKSRTGDGEHSGLGLAICKEITEAHGGDISVTSTPGEGSKFTLRLPV